MESKENHEKHRREKNHFNEAAFDPKYKKGPQEWKEKGNKLHWGSEFGQYSVKIQYILLEN